LVYFAPRGIEVMKEAFGLKIQIAFFNNFKAPMAIVYYGPMLGTMVGIIGSIVPAWSSRRVKVSEVFAQVT